MEWIGLFAEPPALAVSANEHLRFVGRALPEIIELLLGRVWFLSVYELKGLATCDHPVYVIPNPKFPRVGLGTGFGNAHEIQVPLSRRHGLTMALREDLPVEMASLGDGVQRGVFQTALFNISSMTLGARQTLSPP